MAESIADLLGEVDIDEFRIRWPRQFAFFCGGVISEGKQDRPSLRHYLLKDRHLQNKIKADLILAEQANHLYRDTNYSDLITYEEDIAKIAALVMLIAESPGSLAELGAFVAQTHLKSKLCVLVQKATTTANLLLDMAQLSGCKTSFLGKSPFPLAHRQEGKSNKGGIDSHYMAIVSFLNGLLEASPKTFRIGANESSHLKTFAMVLWLANLAQAITNEKLRRYLEMMRIHVTMADLKNCIYCMKLAGWVDVYAYSGTEYIHSRYATDPVDKYVFKKQSRFKDRERWKYSIQAAIADELGLKRPLLRNIAERQVQ